MPLRLTPQNTLSSTFSAGVTGVTRIPLLRRAFHDAKAEFVTLGATGSLSTHKIDVFVGEPRETYVIFSKEIGFAIRSAIARQTGVCFSPDPEKVPLTFFHTSRHFAHGMLLVSPSGCAS